MNKQFYKFYSDKTNEELKELLQISKERVEVIKQVLQERQK